MSRFRILTPLMVAISTVLVSCNDKGPPNLGDLTITDGNRAYLAIKNVHEDRAITHWYVRHADAGRSWGGSQGSVNPGETDLVEVVGDQNYDIKAEIARGVFDGIAEDVFVAIPGENLNPRLNPTIVEFTVVDAPPSSTN